MKYKQGDVLIFIGNNRKLWGHPYGTELIIKNYEPTATYPLQCFYDTKYKYYDNFLEEVVITKEIFNSKLYKALR